MTQPFLGQLQAFGFGFAPRGWAQCNGQILSIAQSSALFALLGTMYGGNGTTTFGLPNLQSRVPMHFGTSPGGNTYFQGAIGRRRERDFDPQHAADSQPRLCRRLAER